MIRREPWNPLLCSYPDSKRVNSVSFQAETMFTRLLAKRDDGGNFDADPKLLLAKLYAERWANGEISDTDTLRMRDELVTAGLIVLYQAGGHDYLHIANCKMALRSDVKRRIEFPEYAQSSDNKELPESVTNPIRIRNESGPSIQSNPIQSNPIESNSAHEIPVFTLQLCKDTGYLIGFTDTEAEVFYHKYNGQGWKKGNGLPITDLPSAMVDWKNKRHLHPEPPTAKKDRLCDCGCGKPVTIMQAGRWASKECRVRKLGW